jgi:hypothetical protein
LANGSPVRGELRLRSPSVRQLFAILREKKVGELSANAGGVRRERFCPSNRITITKLNLAGEFMQVFCKKYVLKFQNFGGKCTLEIFEI